MINQRRALDAWRLRHDGWTFKEVGMRLTPIVSPSRARQLFMQGARLAQVWVADDYSCGYVSLCRIRKAIKKPVDHDSDRQKLGE